ncbi:hypothetical protein [Fulvivirga sp.]|uniref:hypothetical protein n=1 Tax=Fulvivirga sp. TaxID=1931237 RepID=UPI0032EECC4C
MPKSLLIRRSLLLRLLSAIILLFNFAVLKAQDLQNYAEVNVIPPSPNVAAFQKFVDIPVSLYTGTPNVTVPIYEIKMSQLTLPIELKYHASGLKVEEQASWVGAGWALSAGGSVSRTTKGLPDDINETSIGRKGVFHNTKMFNTDGTVRINVAQDCSPQYLPVTSSEPVNNADSVSRGLLDVEPDVYYFNFPEGSGKFLFTYDCRIGPCKIIKYTDDDIKILDHPYDDTGNFPGSGPLPGIDYKWVFESPNGTKYIFDKAERTSILSAGGGSLSAYNPSLDEFQSSWHLTSIIQKYDTINFEYTSELQTYERKLSESGQYLVGGTGTQTNNSFSTNSTQVFAQRLSKITTSNGYEITFHPSPNNRQDLAGSKRLDFVEVKKDNVPVKYLHLNYSYFGNDEKLKLESVIPTNGLSNYDSINGYIFEYFEGTFPAKDSKRQDYWGFYNGAPNPFSLIPPYKNELFHVNKTSSTSREPDFTYGKIGTLSKLIYPTGGFLSLTYESNQAFSEDKLVTYIEEAIAVNNEDITSNFVLASNVSATITKESDENFDSYVEIRKWNGSSYQSITPSQVINGNRFSLTAGQYQLFAHQSVTGTAKISVEYEKNEPGEIEVGGLRLKQLLFKDPIEQSTIVKQFEYISDSLNASSGILFTPASLGGHVSTSIDGISGSTCQSTSSAQYLNLSAYTQIPLAVYQGSHIGYSEVKEYVTKLLSSDKELGYTVHFFENERDDSQMSFPYIAQEDFSFKNGKKKKEIIYEKVGASFRKVRSVTNQYQKQKLDDIVHGMNFKSVKSTVCYECSASNFEFNQYFIQPTWYNLIQTTETEYDENELPQLVTTTDINYLNKTQHNFPVSQDKTTFDGGEYEEIFTRDTSYPALVKEYQILKKTGGSFEKIGGRKVNYYGVNPEQYFEWDNENDSYIKKRQANYSGTPLNEVISNPDIANGGSLTTAYIHGYNDSYPVIESKNQTYAALSAAVGDALISIGYSKGFDDLDNLLNDVLSNGETDVLWAQFNDALRAQSQMLNKQYMTYTYKPGVGISTITDANGECQYYIYDDFNRLIEIRDSQKDLVKSIVYHYMSQN